MCSSDLRDYSEDGEDGEDGEDEEGEDGEDGGSQVAERSGNLARNLKLAIRVLAVPNDVVSLGKTLHPTCLGENVPVLTVSRSG